MARKKKRKHERRKARESALALLYSSEITELDASSIVEQGSYPGDDVDVSEYAEFLLDGVTSHIDEIDERLSSTSENWALDRMPIVDRAILRLAVYEMLFADDVPVSVAINEAVELAKMYGGEDESSRFVNGVLGRIARTIEPGEGSAAVEEVADESEEPVVPDELVDDQDEGADDVATDSASVSDEVADER